MADREVKVTVDIAQTGGLTGIPSLASVAPKPPSITTSPAAVPPLAAAAGHPKIPFGVVPTTTAPNPAPVPVPMATLAPTPVTASLAQTPSGSTANNYATIRTLLLLQRIAEQTYKPAGADREAKDKAPKLGSFNDSFEQSFTNLRAIGMSMQTIAASSAPAAVHTLTGSMQLLGGEVAGLMIPAMAQVSLTIQNIQRSVHGLSEQSRAAISHLGAVGGPLIGAAIGVGVLGTVVKPIVGLIGSMAAMGPLGLAGLAVGGGIAALSSTDKGRDALASVAEALTPAVDVFASAVKELAPVIGDLAKVVKAFAPAIGALAQVTVSGAVGAARLSAPVSSFLGRLAEAMGDRNMTVMDLFRARPGEAQGAQGESGQSGHLAGSFINGNGSFTTGGDLYRDIFSQAIGADDLAQRQRQQMIQNQLLQLAELGRINANASGPGREPPAPATPDRESSSSGGDW